MCLAIPGLITEITPLTEGVTMARVDFGGISKSICIDWIENPVCGDYILAHAGVALCRIDTEEALATLDDFRKLIEYKESADESAHTF